MITISNLIEKIERNAVCPTLVVGSMQAPHGGSTHWAAIVLQDELMATLVSTFNHFTGYEQEVRDHVWFPMAYGDSPFGALANLELRCRDIGKDATTEAFTQWISDVMDIERSLVAQEPHPKHPHELPDCNFKSWLEQEAREREEGQLGLRTALAALGVPQPDLVESPDLVGNHDK